MELFLTIVGGVRNEMGRIREDDVNFGRLGWVEGKLRKIRKLGLEFCRFVEQSIEARFVVIHLN